MDITPTGLTACCVTDAVGLTDVKGVHQLQDEAQLLLSKYERCVRPDEPSRYARLLLVVPCLRVASSTGLSDLFFADTIGPVSLDRVVIDIYRQMTTVV